MTQGSLSLSAFQDAAATHIVDRLTAPASSRRFLLADEVGLGKTVVARAVLERLAQRRRGQGPYNVVYLCSNVEIAEQNRDRLVADGGRAFGRVTELAWRTAGSPPDIQLYSFTPGTSLAASTGTWWERRLILHLIRRVLEINISPKRWRGFFRGDVGEDRWEELCAPRQLEEIFFRQTSTALQDRVRQEWRATQMNWNGQTTPLVAELVDAVESFRWTQDRARRNAVVRCLRTGVQKAALDSLEPHLVILDEVQRFREVLMSADEATSIERRLFAAARTRVLILSATPYRLLTLDAETVDGVGHYADFLQTLRFLFKESGQTTPRVTRVEALLRRYRQQLRKGTFLTGNDPELRATKSSLEAELRQVICRTERNWYVEDVNKGIEAVCEAPPGEPPPQAELVEFVRLRKFLLAEVDAGQLVTEYWKSCPSLLTFMDSGYALMRRLREGKGIEVPTALLTSPREIDTLAGRSYRFRALRRAAFGAGPARPWRWLWLRPCYPYYRDDFFGAEDPCKLLVFSGWRLVPKAISIVLSADAEERIGGKNAEGDQQPLRLQATDERVAFGPFDVVFPSVALARAVSVAQWARESHLTRARLIGRARIAVEELLRERGIEIVDGRGDRLWRIVARLEATQQDGGVSVRTAVKSAKASTRDREEGEVFERYRQQWLDWMDDCTGHLRIGKAEINRLVRIALFSPAVSLLRALWAVGCGVDGVPVQLMSLCLTELRTYWNRALVRRVVNTTMASTSRFYGGRVLDYCQAAHLQAVLDEYMYLIADGVTPDRVGEPCECLAHVFGLGPGSPRANAPRSAGRHSTIAEDAQRYGTHWALAFGDRADQEGEEGPSSLGAGRRSAVRQAFNSPFWPFVLATTSVGQEGLDFHLYCRDVVHWNLPWNPVDLEQREGRINRRNSLAIRRSIAVDWPLEDVPSSSPSTPVWRDVFDAAAASDDLQRFKRGMFPNWIYECRDRTRTARLRRHLPFHPFSEDSRRYAELRQGLALYRLVFGQPRQEDLLEHLRHHLDSAKLHTDEVGTRLPAFMVNLSPFPVGYARSEANREARLLIAAADAPTRLRALLDQVRERQRENLECLRAAAEPLGRLTEIVERHLRSERVPAPQLRAAVQALAYLRNPYDDVFDLYGELGLEDDVNEILRAAQIVDRLLRRRSAAPP